MKIILNLTPCPNTMYIKISNRLKSNLFYYSYFGTHEARHYYNTRFRCNNSLNMSLTYSSKNTCYLYNNRTNTGIILSAILYQPVLNMDSDRMCEAIHLTCCACTESLSSHLTVTLIVLSYVL